MTNYMCGDCSKLLKKKDLKEYKNDKGITIAWVCEDCQKKKVNAEIDEVNEGVEKINKQMENLKEEMTKPSDKCTDLTCPECHPENQLEEPLLTEEQQKVLVNEGLHPKNMVPCGEIGTVKEFKNKPCPHCGSILYEFNGDGFSCKRCGYFPEIEGGC